MRTLFIVISLFFVLSSIPVHSLNSNAPTNENNLFIKNNESLLNNSHITLILAIDNSNSQNNSKGVFTSRKKSIENFVNIISNSHNKNIKIGLVVWNTKPIQKLSLLPSTKFDIINEHIESINTNGNTCLGVGLQAAKKMIDEIDNKDKKYIIYI